MSDPAAKDTETVIEISNVWKIFGDNAAAALMAIRADGLSKAEVLSTYNAVVGVADVRHMQALLINEAKTNQGPIIQPKLVGQQTRWPACTS